MAPPTDTEIALAKELAHDLVMAGVIGDAALDRILPGLTAPAPAQGQRGEAAVK